MKFRFSLIARAKCSFCFNLIIIFIISLYAFLQVTKHFFLLLRINGVHRCSSRSFIRHRCVVLYHKSWRIDNSLTLQIRYLPIICIVILVALAMPNYQMSFAEAAHRLTSIFAPIFDSECLYNRTWNGWFSTVWDATRNGWWVWNLFTISAHIWWVHCGTGVVLFATLSSFGSTLVRILLSWGITIRASSLCVCLSLAGEDALSRLIVIFWQFQGWFTIVLICLQIVVDGSDCIILLSILTTMWMLRFHWWASRYLPNMPFWCATIQTVQVLRALH